MLSEMLKNLQPFGLVLAAPRVGKSHTVQPRANLHAAELKQEEFLMPI